MLLAVGLFYGLYSEGFDRLWTAHLLEDFAAPFSGRVQPVMWLGAVRAVSMVGSLMATEIARRRTNTRRSMSLARVLMLNAGAIVVALAGFGLDRSLRAERPQLALKFLAFTAHRCYTNQQQVHDPQCTITFS